MVGLGRVELPTSPLSGVRSSHLSYRPGSRLPEYRGRRLNVHTGKAGTDDRADTRPREGQSEAPIRKGSGIQSSWGTWQHPTLCPAALARARVPDEGDMCVSAMTFSLRKEVIQPQVLLRLPCYDFTPIMSNTLGGCLPCGLAHRLLVPPTFVM